MQVAVVTGAGRELGRKIAERLARRQIHVVCTDIDEGAARTTAAIVDGTGLGQDVRDPESHRAVAREAAQRGELAIWVNNAGVLAVATLGRLAVAVATLGRVRPLTLTVGLTSGRCAHGRALGPLPRSRSA